MNEALDSLIAYFKQQAQLDVPSYVFSDAFSLAALTGSADRGTKSARAGGGGSVPPAPRAGGASAARRGSTSPAAMPLPAHRFKQAENAGPGAQATAMPVAPATASPPRRAKLAELFYEMKACQKCPLGNLRNNFVFGTGNADASLMVIGEAPGEEEDRQGLPFVGAAGELLTKMLTAISIDRAKQAFISNVVKCRPPDNRNPEPGEVLACSDMLARQIDIIGPRVLLLLGKVAAHALLDSTETVAALRERNGKHFYKGIPAFVTYHPAALLRNDSYRRPAWEDLQKVQKALKEATPYDATATQQQ